MKIKYIYTLRDALKLAIYTLPLKVLTIIAMICALIITFLAGGNYLSQFEAIIFILVWLIVRFVFYFALVYVTGFIIRLFMTIISSRKQKLPYNVQIEIKEIGIKTTTPYMKSEVKWSSFEKIKRIRGYYLFYYRTWQTSFLPQRALDEKQKIQFEKLLKEKGL